ncbi:MAG: RnfABCDGE type electron transport complex subunit G [Clostridiales bacterium]|jgi:electron transport complex protein RnfG|nr:RnfABCDGE type electron transport complex subunit G [Clostridiales bacterium]
MTNVKTKELIAPTLVLVIICLVVTAALAITYQITKPIIEEINLEKANLARAEVLPEGAEGFSPLEGIELIDNVVEVYQANNGSGMIFTIVDKGFGGDITVMVGINSSKEIEGVKVTSHQETPGLGTKAMTVEHLSQYEGKVTISANPSDENGIDAVTGATVSSNAIFRAVETALEQFEKLGGAK